MRIIVLLHANSGDNNQLLGIANIFQSQMPSFVWCEKIKESEFNLSMLTTDDWLLISNDHGLEIAETVKRQYPSMYIVWSGHKPVERFYTLPTELWPNMVVLPETSIDTSFSAICPPEVMLVQTDGVANNVNDITIRDACRLVDKPLPPKTFTHCIGIVLAGDVENPVVCFTPEEAREKAKMIAKSIRALNWNIASTAIMINSAPRVDKFDPKTGLERIPSTHDMSELVENSSAGVFLNEMREYFSREQIFFYHFQRGKPSMYLPMIHRLCQAQRAICLYSADSMNMISESVYLSSHHVPVGVYFPSNARPEHLALVESFYQRGLLFKINETIPSEVKNLKSIKLAAPQVAMALMQQYFISAHFLRDRSTYFQSMNQAVLSKQKSHRKQDENRDTQSCVRFFPKKSPSSQISSVHLTLTASMTNKPS